MSNNRGLANILKILYAKGFPKKNISLIYRTFFLGMVFGAISEPFLENMKCHLIKPHKRIFSVLLLSYQGCWSTIFPFRCLYPFMQKQGGLFSILSFSKNRKIYLWNYRFLTCSLNHFSSFSNTLLFDRFASLLT